MLWTDGYIVSAADLAKLDSEISDISSAQNIDLPGAIDDAQQEAAQAILGRAQRFLGRTQPVFMPVEYGVQSVYSESAQRPRVSLNQIVVTDGDYPEIWTDLKRWVVMVTLFTLYRNASRRQSNSLDRYKEKRDEYDNEIRLKYWPRFINNGLPIVGRPMPRPGARFEQGSGTWSETNITVTANGGALTQYDVAISYVNTLTPNSESALTDPITISAGASDTVTFDISTLRPPNGTYRPAAISRIAVNPAQATHWNIYAGISGSTLYRQATIPISTLTGSIGFPLLASTTPAGPGQYADLYETLPKFLMRG